MSLFQVSDVNMKIYAWLRSHAKTTAHAKLTNKVDTLARAWPGT